MHGANFVLHTQDHAEHIRVKPLRKRFRGLTLDRVNWAFGASIVHRHVEATKPRAGFVDHGADVSLIADAGVDELGLRTERT